MIDPRKFRQWLERMAREHIVDDESRLDAVRKIEQTQAECGRMRGNGGQLFEPRTEAALFLENLQREWGLRR